MSTDLKKAAGDFFNSPAGEKLSDKKDEIMGLIDSDDGQKVKKMIEGGGVDIMGALQAGDMKTLKGALSGLLSTEEGARLAGQIMNMIK